LRVHLLKRNRVYFVSSLDDSMDRLRSYDLASHSLKRTTWAWVGGLFLLSIVFSTLFPSLIIDSSSVRKCVPEGDLEDGVIAAWCHPDPFDTWFADVFHATNFAMFWAVVSHTFNFVVAPVFAYYLVCLNLPAESSRFCSEKVKYAVIIISAMVSQTCPNSILKMTANRQRPCFFFNRAQNTEASYEPRTQFKSFYSGDASTGCVALSAGMMIVCMLERVGRGGQSGKLFHNKIFRKYRWAILGIASVGSFGRVFADMHWMTDVLTGILVGSLFGSAWVYVLHEPKRAQFSEEEDDGNTGLLEQTSSA
jgi:membrane-associated phospholipid phosphatase